MKHVLMTSKKANVLTKSDQMFMLGETHWLKLAILARTHSNLLHEFFLLQEVLVRNMKLKSQHQQGEFRKGQKLTLHVQTPRSILLTGIHLGWARLAPPERTESEWLAKDNSETNPITIRLRATWESSSPRFPYPTALCLGAPAQ